MHSFTKEGLEVFYVHMLLSVCIMCVIGIKDARLMGVEEAEVHTEYGQCFSL